MHWHEILAVVRFLRDEQSSLPAVGSVCSWSVESFLSAKITASFMLPTWLALVLCALGSGTSSAMTGCPCALDWAAVSWCPCRASRSVCLEDRSSASRWGPLSRRRMHRPSSPETLLHATTHLCAPNSALAQRLHCAESDRGKTRKWVGRATIVEGHRCSQW